MDNITHSLIGITVAQWAVQTAAQPTNKENFIPRNRLWIWISIAANNFPDLDVLYTMITPGLLGRLLHHRGHTHTLVAIIPQLAIIFLLFWIFRRPLGFSKLSRDDWKKALWIGGLGLFLHILADSFNSYGVHPFFPVWNGWVYGDSVFIIEPILWLIFGVGIFLSRRGSTTAARAALILAATFVIACFGLSRSLRKNYFYSSEGRVIDVVLSPMPAIPICWFAIQLAVNDETYTIQRGMISVLPMLLRADQCPNLGRVGEQPGYFQAGGFTEAYWSEKYTNSFSDLGILEDDCHFKAWMRFGRVPYLSGGMVTDLRFSRGGLGNFSGLDLGGEICPPNIPPWIPPRMDLLELTGKAR